MMMMCITVWHEMKTVVNTLSKIVIVVFWFLKISLGQIWCHCSAQICL